MKRGTLWGALVGTLILMVGSATALGVSTKVSPVPRVLEYDGTLEKEGIPVSGDWDLRFQLVDASGAALWPDEGSSETWSERAVTITKGRFHQAFPADGDPDLSDEVFDASALRLRIGVRSSGDGAWSDLSPDVELSAVPYAVRAERAERAGLAEEADRAVEADHAVEAESAGTAALAEALETGGVVMETATVEGTCDISTPGTACGVEVSCETGWTLMSGGYAEMPCSHGDGLKAEGSYPLSSTRWYCYFAMPSTCSATLTQTCFATCARLSFPR